MTAFVELGLSVLNSQSVFEAQKYIAEMRTLEIRWLKFWRDFGAGDLYVQMSIGNDSILFLLEMVVLLFCGCFLGGKVLVGSDDENPLTHLSICPFLFNL
jgi:hypothetical protein